MGSEVRPANVIHSVDDKARRLDFVVGNDFLSFRRAPRREPEIQPRVRACVITFIFFAVEKAGLCILV